MLGIESARLLLHGSKRTGHGNSRQLSLGVLRCVHIGSKLDAVTVLECDLLVVNLVTLRERFVPFLR